MCVRTTTIQGVIVSPATQKISYIIIKGTMLHNYIDWFIGMRGLPELLITRVNELPASAGRATTIILQDHLGKKAFSALIPQTLK
jgi:hypothetical protein